MIYPGKPIIYAVFQLYLVCSISKAVDDELPEPDTVSDWISKIADCLKNAGCISAEMEQAVIRADGGETLLESGSVLLSEKGQIKLAYDGKHRKVVVTDAFTVRSYNGEADILYRYSSRRDALAQFLFMLLKGEVMRLKEQFDFRAVGEVDKLQVLELSAKSKDNVIMKILVTLSDECPFVKRLLLIDQASNIVRLTFSDFNLEASCNRKAFRLKVPQKTREVRP